MVEIEAFIGADLTQSHAKGFKPQREIEAAWLKRHSCSLRSGTMVLLLQKASPHPIYSVRTPV